jgi:phosphatidylserine decarboxylase
MRIAKGMSQRMECTAVILPQRRCPENVNSSLILSFRKESAHFRAPVLAIPNQAPYKFGVEAIRYFNRHTGNLETEKVYGEGFLRWTYGHPAGGLARWAFVRRPFFSAWYGRKMSTPESAKRVEPFIAHYDLDPSEFAEKPGDFVSFNDFFSRKLKPSARPIDPAEDSVVFPADGRHLGFHKASAIQGVFVKGQKFNLPALLGDESLAAKYADGALVLSRLCPVDYHRFHFPAAGVPGPVRTIDGPLYSVSPIALRKRLAYLWTNKRTITRLETPNLGTVLLLEIGATCVGTIVQTYRDGHEVRKGDEKGYFAFGGSSTITIFEPGAVRLEADLLDHSSRQTELYAKVGTRMARPA